MKPYHDWNKKAWLAGVLLAMSIIILLLTRIPSCGRDHTVVVDPPAPAGKTCGELKPGDTKSEECQAPKQGKKVYVCSEAGTLDLAVDDCKDPADPCAGKPKQVSFDGEIKDLMTDRCLGCHFTPQRYDSYEVSKSLAPEMLRRINLASDNLQRMPKAPQPELSPAEKADLKAWVDGGMIETYDCNAQGGSGYRFIGLDQIEAAIILDLDKLDADDRVNTRYLVLSHRYDLDQGAGGLGEYRGGAEKALNSLNSTGEDIFLTTPIDVAETILRFDLRAYDFTIQDWDAVQAADRLDIESFTTNGELIKLLTKTRKAWMHVDNFMDVALRNSAVYYDIMETPELFQQLTGILGVNFAGDLASFDALLVGFNGSKIAEQKNRLLSRHESRDGYFWNTYDTVALNGVPQRNLFEFPLLKETGGKALFEFAAGETIYSLPNGLQGYALFNAEGLRQDVAPLDIVRDTDSPVSSEIRNANSCSRCHASGLIPARDEVRGHVLANASQFEIGDVEKVGELYRQANSVAAAFSADNNRFGKALTLVGVKPGAPDPISKCLDRFLLDWNLEQVASFVLLPVADFSRLLNQSAAARAQIGQLLSGSTITYEQLVAVLPILKADLRLFQDAINQ